MPRNLGWHAKNTRTRHFGEFFILKVRKCVKLCLFLLPDLRTRASIGNPIKKTPKRTVIQIWQGHLCNSRAEFMRDLLLFGKEIKTFLQIL